MEITLINAPDEKEWMEVKQRAMVTIGKKAVTPPDSEWKHKILEARHSPIRHLMYSFYIEDMPSWVSVHFCRHVHSQPFVKTQRNDRQNVYDRAKAPQGSPVNMIYDVNAEQLISMANKRLCYQASKETREVMEKMCELAEAHTPELHGLLVPMCEHCGGICHEMYPCGKANKVMTKQQIITMLEKMVKNDNDGITVGDMTRLFSQFGDTYKDEKIDDVTFHKIVGCNGEWSEIRPFIHREGDKLGVFKWE